MSPENLNKSVLKLILRTSQGFPAQEGTSKARVKISNGSKYVSPSRSGHPISNHVRGAAITPIKTKFCSLDDMAAALELLLKTDAGQQDLAQLADGVRVTVEGEIPRLFRIEGVIDGIGTVSFHERDLRKASISRLKCVAILEGRSRNGELHLHVQTFYPAVNPVQLYRLFDAKTAP